MQKQSSIVRAKRNEEKATNRSKIKQTTIASRKKKISAQTIQVFDEKLV
jgi:hypothetical protein